MPEHPHEIVLGTQRFLFRLMSAADTGAMLSFAATVPPEDRLFLRRDITDPADVQGWVDEVAAGDNTTVLATNDEGIAGYVSISTESYAWTQHRAELRVLVAPPVRRIGLGRALVSDAISLALAQGSAAIDARMTAEQRDARAMFVRLGFVEVAVLPAHVRDRQGRTHDLAVMSLQVPASS